jgi:undecaprenyl-diphosphatase
MVSIAFFSVLLARGIIVELIRFFWKRPRPFLENNVKLLLNHSLEPSFPSGHADFYFAFTIIIYSYNKKSGFLFFLAAILISFSRILAGVHWLSDILAGALLGIFSGLFVILFFRRSFLNILKKQPQLR